jgi:mono/diheme cytochrome c family protein
MARVRRRGGLLPIACLLMTAVNLQGQTAPAELADAVRMIPGVTGEDPFPRGCVDCHAPRGGPRLAAPLSALMRQWYEAIPPGLQLAGGSAPAGMRPEGRHPRSERALRDIPAGCLTCHGPNSRRATAFGPLVHIIHLRGGIQNRYLSDFGGECTYCHKLDTATGQWRVPSAPE